MWTYLDLDRIYTKPKNCIPDYDSPVVLKKGSSVGDFCRSVHKDLLNNFKFAIVWGSSGRCA
jgi:developmentally-regulated GTP-binding protein 1